MDRALALLSGALLALSFPRYGHGALGLIALVPWLVALSGWMRRPGHWPGHTASRGAWLGTITGVVFYSGTLYWTSATVGTFGGLPLPLAIGAAFLLVLYMSAYVAAAGAVTAILVARLGWIGLPLGATAWVALEYVRGFLIGGFPWIPLGNTLIDLLPLAQMASVGGIYLLSLFVGLVNAGFALMLMVAPRLRLRVLAATLALVAVPALWGAARLGDGRLLSSGTPVRVGLVQANVLQVDKWNRAKSGEILQKYMSLSTRAVEAGARVVLWAESATPFLFDEDVTGQTEMRSFVQALGVPLLFGSDEIEHEPQVRFFNSAFMLDGAGATAAVYRKMHLVPFGEWVPFKHALFFVKPLVEAVADFSPGTRVTMMPVDGHMVSTAICYEVTYPGLMREAVQQGSELLTTITNDAWYGESSAPFQHFEMAAVRAIEQGRYLVRAANTGITGIVDPYGRIVTRTALGDTTVVVGDVRFLQERTVYATIGDVVAFASGLLTLLALLAATLRRPWLSSSMN